MDYSAKNFEADVKEVVYLSDLKKAMRVLKKFNPLFKKLIVDKYKFGVGDIFEEKRGGHLFLHYPIVSYDEMDIDKFWDVVDKPVSLDVFDLIDETGISEYWEYEGIKENRKFAGKNVVDIILNLK